MPCSSCEYPTDATADEVPRRGRVTEVPPTTDVPRSSSPADPLPPSSP
jgi:hypothetical protein